MSHAAEIPNPRRFLSANALIAGLRRRFQEVPDRREASGTKYSMTDTLMAAFAMFSLALFPLNDSSTLRCWPFKNVAAAGVVGASRTKLSTR